MTIKILKDDLFLLGENMLLLVRKNTESVQTTIQNELIASQLTDWAETEEKLSWEQVDIFISKVRQLSVHVL